jgi:two-component SAPR family response regulator
MNVELEIAAGPRQLRAARARLGRDDLSVLPALEEAYGSLQRVNDACGKLLTAAHAVQTIAAAYADFREAARWVRRLREDEHAFTDLSPRERLVVCGAIVSAAVIVDTTGFDSPAVAHALEQALQLLASDLGEDATDDVIAVARALLEYVEQQGQPDTFHRVVAAARSHCDDANVGPLLAGRYWIYQARCVFRLGAYDTAKSQDVEANALLARAEARATEANLPQLHFDVRYARLLLAAIRNDGEATTRLVGEMHEVLDYTRPNCVALYYQHLARVHLMHDQVAQAFEAATHALRAGQLAACVAGEQRSYQIMHALALLASGECARGIAEIEAILPSVSGRPHAILQCTLRFGEAWKARLTDGADYRQRLQRAMQQAQELNWPLFLNSVPRLAAQLAADALRYDFCSELARRAIALRRLMAPSDADDRWPWPIRIYALGRFAVFIDGAVLKFSGKTQKKPLELLKCALTLGGRGVDSGALTEALWPDLDGDAARNAFDLALHRLRKLLHHDDAVSMQDGKLTLDAKRIWADLWAFERLCAQFEGRADQEVTPASASEAAERLLRYYAGHFLVADAAPWTLSMRERLRSKLLRAIAAMGQHLERHALWDEAIVLYRRANELDSLAEEFYRRLMLAYRAQGRIAEALDVYRRCRDLLSITLGVEPSAPTQALYRSLKS